jgi:hypothetical protein
MRRQLIWRYVLRGAALLSKAIQRQTNKTPGRIRNRASGNAGAAKRSIKVMVA